MSVNQQLDLTLNTDTIEISIGRNTLLKALQRTEDWPLIGRRKANVTDKELFFEELTALIVDEDSDGLSAVEQMFVRALADMIASGTSTIEEEAEEEELPQNDYAEWN